MGRVQEIRERLAKATPWPWTVSGDTDKGHVLIVGSGPLPVARIGYQWEEQQRVDAVLIANAPADLAYLLEIAEAAAAFRDKMIDRNWERLAKVLDS